MLVCKRAWLSTPFSYDMSLVYVCFVRWAVMLCHYAQHAGHLPKRIDLVDDLDLRPATLLAATVASTPQQVNPRALCFSLSLSLSHTYHYVLRTACFWRLKQNANFVFWLKKLNLKITPAKHMHKDKCYRNEIFSLSLRMHTYALGIWPSHHGPSLPNNGTTKICFNRGECIWERDHSFSNAKSCYKIADRIFSLLWHFFQLQKAYCLAQVSFPLLSNRDLVDALPTR